MKKKEIRTVDAIEMVEKARKREVLRKRRNQGLSMSVKPQNIFPFSPVREGRPNPLGFYLDKWDCRILRGIQEHGFKPIREFCKLAKIPEKKFYERFKVNKDLAEAMKLLAFSSLAIAFPKAMGTLAEKFPESARWAELYLKVCGLIDEPSLKLSRPDQEGDQLLGDLEIERLLDWKG